MYFKPFFKVIIFFVFSLIYLYYFLNMYVHTHMIQLDSVLAFL